MKTPQAWNQGPVPRNEMILGSQKGDFENRAKIDFQNRVKIFYKNLGLILWGFRRNRDWVSISPRKKFSIFWEKLRIFSQKWGIFWRFLLQKWGKNRQKWSILGAIEDSGPKIRGQKKGKIWKIDFFLKSGLWKSICFVHAFINLVLKCCLRTGFLKMADSILYSGNCHIRPLVTVTKGLIWQFPE